MQEKIRKTIELLTRQLEWIRKIYPAHRRTARGISLRSVARKLQSDIAILRAQLKDPDPLKENAASGIIARIEETARNSRRKKIELLTRRLETTRAILKTNPVGPTSHRLPQAVLRLERAIKALQDELKNQAPAKGKPPVALPPKPKK